MKGSVKVRTEEDLYVETGYRIIFEDGDFLAVEKPAPLPVHAVGRFTQKNLLSLLKKDLGEAGRELRIVNRIDSETSGLVLVAKSSEAAGKLGLLFEKRKVAKEYHAVVFGIPEKPRGTISIPLGTKIYKQQRIRTPDPAGESAVTHYEVLQSSNGRSLLKILPETGRTHQIRSHLSFAGNPIAGDKIYIDPDIFERYLHEGWQDDMETVTGAKRLLLHASGLVFRHPRTGVETAFFSPLPACFSL